MDYEILVNELRHILTLLQQEHGHMILCMLKAVEAEMNDWNLIVSTQVYDDLSTKEALSQLVNLTNTHLSPEIRKHILRFTILKTSDPFVREMTTTYQNIHIPQYIQSVYIGNIFIEKAIILASQRSSAMKRTPIQKKSVKPILEHA